jgi:hypothetical protein
MRVLNERPPMFDEIDKAFKVRGKPVLFCWGNRIYFPTGGQIHASIMAHEEAHADRMGIAEAGIEQWWRRYIDDAEFRLREEVIGHRAELKWYLDRGGGRQEKRRYTAIIAAKLAAPIYGGLVSVSRAKELLLES